MAGDNSALQRRLKEFLDNAAKEKAAQERERERARQAPELFADAFKAVAALKIRPALADACGPWLDRGLIADVVVEGPSPHVSISLVVETHPNEQARLVYTGRPDDRSVLVSRHFRRGAREEIGQFGLNDITREIVRAHVKEFIKEMVK